MQCLFYFPPDGQARVQCAWGHCGNKQAPKQRMNLCDMHARFVYRDLSVRLAKAEAQQQYELAAKLAEDLDLLLGARFEAVAEQDQCLR